MVPLELSSDCFRDENFLFFLLQATTEDGSDSFELLEAAMFVCNSQTDAILNKNLRHFIRQGVLLIQLVYFLIFFSIVFL